MSKEAVTKDKSRSDIPAEVQVVLGESERSICLPYELTIIEVDSILSAIKRASGSSTITVDLSKGSNKKAISSPSAFDIWEFIFTSIYQLPTALCSLVHKPTNSTVIWDRDERFVVIAGSATFCETAFPHSYDVLEYFYVQSTVNEFEDEKNLRALFANLTSGGSRPTEGDRAR